MTLGHSWSLHSEPDEILNYILCITCVYTSLWIKWNEVRMNEWGKISVFEQILPSWGSICWALIFGKSWCQVHDSKVLCHMKEWYEKCYLLQDVMCYVQDFMCCAQYDKYDDVCYSHGMTLLIQIRKVHSLS